MNGSIDSGSRYTNYFIPHMKSSTQLYAIGDGTSELHLSAMPTVSGPYQVTVDGVRILYGVFANSIYDPMPMIYRLEVWTSTDGLLWVECDGANRKTPLESNCYSVFCDSTNKRLYIAYLFYNGSAEEIRLADFDMLTGDWGTLDVTAGPTPFYGDKYSGPENLNFGVVRRSDESILVGYTALQVKSGNNRSRARYILYEDSAWGSPVDIDPIGNSDSLDRETYMAGVVMDNSERTGFFILDYYGTLYYISLDSSNQLDSFHQIIQPGSIYGGVQYACGAPVGGAKFRIPYLGDVRPGTRIYAPIPPILNRKGAHQVMGVPSADPTFWAVELAGSAKYIQSDENSMSYPLIGRSMYRVAACAYPEGSLEGWARCAGVTIPWSVFWLNRTKDAGFSTAPYPLIQTDGYEFAGCCMNTITEGVGAFIEVEGTGPFQNFGTVLYWQGAVPSFPLPSAVAGSCDIY